MPELKGWLRWLSSFGYTGPSRWTAFSTCHQKAGLFKKQLGAYTMQFAGSLSPQPQPAEVPFTADLSYCRLHKAT